MISVTCTCGKVLRAKEELAGRAAQCPHCQEKVKVPAAASHGTPQHVAAAPATTGSSKSMLLSGIAVGLLAGLIVLVLYFGLNRNKPTGSSGDSPANDATLASSAAPGVKTAPSITASPNPVPAGQEKFGKTTISWDTGDGSIGQVYVAINGEERRFSGGKPKGSQEAAWIGKGEYEFRLYAGTEHKTVLAHVRVTRTK